MLPGDARKKRAIVSKGTVDMNTKWKPRRISCILLVCAVLSLAFTGFKCETERPTDADGYTGVSVVVSVGGWGESGHLVQGGGPVDLDQIAAFLITVDRITLNPCADDDSVGKVTVFDASEQPAIDNEINLVDLARLREIVSSAEVPPGDYAQIRMEISAPRLSLAGDPPGGYRTNIKLTANGRLFAKVDLTIPPGETVDLHLALDQIHLVRKGNGDFVLTPQLRVHLLPEL